LLIGIDAGNTNIVVGIFDEDKTNIEPLYAWRFTTTANATPDELAAPIIAQLLHHNIPSDGMNYAVVSSVVPGLDYPLHKMLQGTFRIQETLFINHETDTGLLYDYPTPSEVGADRIVNAAAGIQLYSTPLIIIDFGTATTFCCISKSGAYMGGQILPGVGISLQALSSRAAKLSSVHIKKPSSPMGRSTETGMEAGIYYQTVGAAEKIISLLSEEIGSKPFVLATGGYAALFKDAVTSIDKVDTDLTLKGLKIIFSRIFQ